MIFTPLASSSAGNAYIADDGKSRILIECGIPIRKLQQLCGFELSAFAGCLVSHEHMDHAKSAAALHQRGIPLYMSTGTAYALGLASVERVENMEQFTVGSFDIVAFNTFHDAHEPLGFLLRSREDGERLVFATDTVNFQYKIPRVDIIALEANYSEDILAGCQKMPDRVKERIRRTHMEIGTLCDYLRRQDLSKCREIHLLHLSAASSNEADFVRSVMRQIPQHIHVFACAKCVENQSKKISQKKSVEIRVESVMKS